MNAPAWFHGRLQSRFSQVEIDTGAAAIVGAARNRVGLTIGISAGLSAVITPASASTFTGATTGFNGTADFTFAGTDTSTPGSDALAEWLSVNVATNEADVVAGSNVWNIGYLAPLQLWWWLHGDITLSPIWGGTAGGDADSICVIETLLIEGTLDEYKALVRNGRV
jgi:hypothetical protein